MTGTPTSARIGTAALVVGAIACAGGAERFGVTPGAAAIPVAHVLESPGAHLDRPVNLEGVILALDQRDGLFFYLRDERGGLFVTIPERQGWGLPPEAERRHARVAGRVRRDQLGRYYLSATGVELGATAF